MSNEMSVEDFEIVALGQRHVRTPEGAEFYHLPIGAPITKKDELLAKAENAAKGIAEPKGALGNKPTSAELGQHLINGHPVTVGPAEHVGGLKVGGGLEHAPKPYYPNLEKGQRAANGSPLAAANDAAHTHGTDGQPETPLKLKLVKPTIEGNQHFKIGAGEFSAPEGSKLIKPEGNTELGYVLAPDGSVHAFNEHGEVTIPDTLQSVFQTKFSGDLSKDPHYSEHPFDGVSASHGIEALQPGDKLHDQNGEPQFTKQPDGSFKHDTFGAIVGEKDLKPAFDKGQLVPAKNKKNDIVENAFKDTKATNFNDMSDAEFTKALDDMPEGTVLTHGTAGDLTKQKNGSWKSEKSLVDNSSSSLFFVRKDLSVKADKSAEPETNPLAGNKPAAEEPKVDEKIGQKPDLHWLKNAEQGAKVEYINNEGGKTEWTKGPTGNWNHSATDGEPGTGTGLTPEDVHKYSNEGEKLTITSNGDGSESGVKPTDEAPAAPNAPGGPTPDEKQPNIPANPEQPATPSEPVQPQQGDRPAPAPNEADKLPTVRQQAPLSVEPGKGDYKKQATSDDIKNASEGDAVLVVFGHKEDGEKVEYEKKGEQWVNPQDPSDTLGPLAMSEIAGTNADGSDNPEEEQSSAWLHTNNQPVLPREGDKPTPEWLSSAKDGDQVQIGATLWTKDSTKENWTSQSKSGSIVDMKTAALSPSVEPNSPHETKIVKSGSGPEKTAPNHSGSIADTLKQMAEHAQTPEGKAASAEAKAKAAANAPKTAQESVKEQQDHIDSMHSSPSNFEKPSVHIGEESSGFEEKSGTFTGGMYKKEDHSIHIGEDSHSAYTHEYGHALDEKMGATGKEASKSGTPEYKMFAAFKANGTEVSNKYEHTPSEIFARGYDDWINGTGTPETRKIIGDYFKAKGLTKEESKTLATPNKGLIPNASQHGVPEGSTHIESGKGNLKDLPVGSHVYSHEPDGTVGHYEKIDKTTWKDHFEGMGYHWKDGNIDGPNSNGDLYVGPAKEESAAKSPIETAKVDGSKLEYKDQMDVLKEAKTGSQFVDDKGNPLFTKQANGSWSKPGETGSQSTLTVMHGFHEGKLVEPKNDDEANKILYPEGAEVSDTSAVPLGTKLLDHYTAPSGSSTEVADNTFTKTGENEWESSLFPDKIFTDQHVHNNGQALGHKLTVANEEKSAVQSLSKSPPPDHSGATVQDSKDWLNAQNPGTQVTWGSEIVTKQSDGTWQSSEDPNDVLTANNLGPAVAGGNYQLVPGSQEKGLVEEKPDREIPVGKDNFEVSQWLNGQKTGTKLYWKSPTTSNTDTFTKLDNGKWNSEKHGTDVVPGNMAGGVSVGQYGTKKDFEPAIKPPEEKATPDAAPETIFKVGDTAKGVDHLNAMVSGTSLKYTKKDKSSSMYVKLDDGSFLTPGGQHMSAVDLKNASFTVDSLPGNAPSDPNHKFTESELDNMPEGTKLDVKSNGGDVAYTYEKGATGWHTDGFGKESDAINLPSSEIASDQTFGPHTPHVDTPNEPAKPELDTTPSIQATKYGKAYSESQLHEAINGLEGHSGFQIKYGLKNLSEDHPLNDSEEVAHVTEAAKEKYPALKPKQALISYLKDKAGINNGQLAPWEEELLADPNEKKINIGSKTPKAGAQGFDGGEYSPKEIQNAIDILEAHQGKVFKSELNKKGNKLGELDPNKIVGQNADKTITKQKFIDVLKAKLAAQSENNTPSPTPGKLLSGDELADKPLGSQVLYTPNFPKADGTFSSEVYTKTDQGWENEEGGPLSQAFVSHVADANDLGNFTPISEPDSLPDYAKTPVAAQANSNDAAHLLVGQVATEQQLKDLPIGSVVSAGASPSAVYTKTAPNLWTHKDGIQSYPSSSFILDDSENKIADIYKYHVKSVPEGLHYNEAGIQTGKYSTESGKAYMVVNADGTGVYVNGSGSVSAITSDKVKSLHGAGMNKYGGVVDNVPEVTPQAKAAAKKPVAKKKKNGPVTLADGTYYLGDSNNANSTTYHVKGDQVEIWKNGAGETVPIDKIKTAFYGGKIVDGEGNSVLPADHTGSVTLWNKPSTSVGLIEAKKMLEDGQLDNFFSPSTQETLKQNGLYVNWEDMKQRLIKDDPDLASTQTGYYWQSSSFDKPEWNEPAKAKLEATIDGLLKNINQDVPENETSAYFNWVGDGEASYPQDMAGLDYSSYNLTSLTNFVKSASNSFAGGGVIGTVPMNKSQKQQWAAAFVNGDFAKLYKIEVAAAAEKGKSHPTGFLHPGFIGNTETNHIQWSAAVPGEIAAGKDIEGNWSDVGVSQWSPAELDNYLIKAQMQNPEHLTLAEKRSWVSFHRVGNKTQTDGLSVRALRRKEQGEPPLSEPAVWNDDIKPAKSYDSAFDNGPIPSGAIWGNMTAASSHQWAVDNWDSPSPLPDLGVQSFKEWSNENHDGFDPNVNPNIYTSSQRTTAYWNYVNTKHQEELAKPVYTKVKSISDGQSHDVDLMQDQFGKQYIFKPVDDPSHKFRADVEDAANKLGKLFGFGSPNTQIMTLDGKYGLMQDYVPNVSSFAGPDGNGLDMTSMSGKQLGAVAQEHVLDWILDNDDTHWKNLLLKEDGGVVGIDKGRGLYVYGNWAGVTGDSSAHSNAQLIYTDLYNGIRDGSISKEQADTAYFAAMKAATRIQKTDDAKVTDLVLQGVANRTKWSPPDYMTHFDHTKAPTNADELVKAVLDRKANLPDQIKTMWEGIYEKAGYSLPEPPPKALGEEHLSGWAEPDTISKAAEMKVWGAAPVHASAGIVNGHSLLWTEKINGEDTTKGKLTVGDLTQAKLLEFLSPKASKAGGNAIPEPQGIPNFPDLSDWKSAQSAVGKDVTKHAVDKDFTPGLEEKLNEVTSQMSEDLDHWSPTLGEGKEPDEMIQFPSGKNVPVGALGQYKLALGHYLAQSKKATDALNTGEPTQKDDFSVFKPLPFKNDPLLYTNGNQSYKQLINGQFLSHEGKLINQADLPDPVKNQENGWSSSLSNKEVVSGPSYILKTAGDYTGTLKDGGLKETTDTFGTSGHNGTEYEITLPTGEVINFRNSNSTGTSTSQKGRLTFTLAGGDSAASLARVQDHLSLMGLDASGANEQDAETVYWRNMFGRVLGSKGGGSKVEAARELLLSKAGELNGKFPNNSLYWQNVIEAIGLSSDSGEEHAFWDKLGRDTYGDDTVSKFLSDGEHLPHYQHMDLSNPTNNTGTPYWKRIDVSVDDMKKQAPEKMIAIGNSGGDDSLLKYITSGGMLSTEERLRVLGHYKTGMSSSSDQGTGGANSVFTRITDGGPNGTGYVAYWNPAVLEHVGTYSFAGDEYGNVSNQSSDNKYNPLLSLKDHNGGSNETMIPNALSIYDHMELMVFEDVQKRDEAIQRLKKIGITELRGLPIEQRIIMRANIKSAIAAVKKNWVLDS